MLLLVLVKNLLVGSDAALLLLVQIEDVLVKFKVALLLLVQVEVDELVVELL